MYKFNFADIGEGLHEGVIAQIYKKEGDLVKEGDPLFSVETDKVTSDIPSPVDGKVLKVSMKVGDTIHVGQEIYVFDDGKGESIAEAPKVTEGQKAEAPVKEKAPSVVGDLEESDELFTFGMHSSNKTSETITNKANDSAPASQTKHNYDYDVVIVGAGPGGYLAGELLGKAGLKTVVIEKEKAGGVCLNVGCIPTKTLLKSSKILHYVKESKMYGIDINEASVKIDWSAIQARKDKVSNTLSKGIEMLLKAAKAEYMLGEAQFIDAHTLKVKDKTFTTQSIILATGSSSIDLPLPGFAQAKEKGIVIDSTGALNLKHVPEKMIIVGGGVIGLEFATLFNEMGSKVTILEGLPKILGPIDSEISTEAEKIAKKNGINIITSAAVQSIEDGKIQYKVGTGSIHNLSADKILVCVGRRPNSAGFENLGIELGKRKEVVVDKHMRTNVPTIYAIGDLTAHAMLAHTAYRHAKIVVNTILGIEDHYDRDKVPAAIYTYPEISVIGKTEEELKAEGIPYLKAVVQNNVLGKALADGEMEGFTKLLFGQAHGEIYGCHMINSVSSDIISEIAAFMELEGTIFELNKTIHPHPSIAETLAEIALKTISTWQKAQKN